MSVKHQIERSMHLFRCEDPAGFSFNQFSQATPIGMNEGAADIKDDSGSVSKYWMKAIYHALSLVGFPGAPSGPS